VARTLAVYRPRRFRIRVNDGEPRDVDAWLLAVGNGPVYGGGMQIAPDARLDDGVFDVCIVRAMSRAALIGQFPRLFKGTHVRHPAVEIRRAKSVSLHADRPFTLYADGEPVGPLPATLEVEPSALPLIVP
jgi:diacylglycerol kinase (ATP)